MKNSSMRTVTLIWAAVMIAVLSSTATLLISGRAIQQTTDDARWVTQEEYETVQRYKRLEDVRKTLLNEYYQPLDEDVLMEGALRGMTGIVRDPYTYYLTKEDMERENEDNSGAYRGIGVLLQRTSDGGIQILRVYPDSPAEAAGLRAGDRIVAVDGKTISGADGRTYNAAVTMIRGEDGTQVVLTLVRDGRQMDVTVNRGDVNISYASYRMLEGDIGYISITQFSGNAADVFHEAVEYFRENGAKGIVIDVRDNPGGFLDQVVRVADELLPTGVIVYIKERDGTRHDYYSDEAMVDVPVAVLVNGMSASASEILASAVQAFDRGTVIGTRTYGKGIVQSLITYPEDGTGLQLTTSSYYDALDRCPHGVGVTPDIEVALDADTVPDEPDPKSDTQLAAAIEDLKRQREQSGSQAE